MPQHITIKSDSHTIGARHWSDKDNHDLVIIGPAMGVSQHFYSKFAKYLYEKDFDILTFDYHGIGNSQNRPIRNIKSDAMTWARSDLGECIRWARENYENDRLLTVCHSLSGQILGLTEEARHLDKIVTIAASSGYWNQYEFPKNLLFGFVWSVIYPLPTRILGYFPGSFLGLGEDLPRNVALQVAGWARRSGYIRNFSTYEDIYSPILAISFSDDSYCPKRGVDWIHERYKNASLRRWHLNPEDLESDSIGHFGFFRNGNLKGLWEDVVQWLRKRK